MLHLLLDQLRERERHPCFRRNVDLASNLCIGSPFKNGGFSIAVETRALHDVPFFWNRV